MHQLRRRLAGIIDWLSQAWFKWTQKETYCGVSSLQLTDGHGARRRRRHRRDGYLGGRDGEVWVPRPGQLLACGFSVPVLRGWHRLQVLLS